MKLANTKSIFSDIPALCNLYSGPSLQTESNALSRSAIIVMPYLLLVIALFIFFTSGRIACNVFLLFWYACRLLFWKNCDCSSKLTVSCRMILSQILPSVFFFKLGFTPCKVKQPLRGMELQERKHKEDYRIQEICLERT